MSIHLVEGWTERIKYALKRARDAQDLTGMDVELIAHTHSGAEATFSGTAGIETAADGIVYFDPAEDDLVSADAPYEISWKVTDVANKVAFFPNGPAEKWIVRRP